MRSLWKNWKKMGKKIKIKLVFHNSTNQAVNISSRIFSLFTQRVCFFNLQKNGSFCLSILKINVKFTQHKVSHLKVNRSGDQNIFITAKGDLVPIKQLLPIPTTPTPWLLPICFLHLWIYPFWLLHISRIIQYVTF